MDTQGCYAIGKMRKQHFPPPVMTRQSVNKVCVGSSIWLSLPDGPGL